MHLWFNEGDPFGQQIYWYPGVNQQRDIVVFPQTLQMQSV